MIGVFLGVLSPWFGNDPDARLLVVIGFLGAETTFSSFTSETVALMETGHPRRAVVNVLGSVGLGLAGTALGLAIAEVVTGGAW